MVPGHWHSETWVCSLRGHATPAARVRRLRPEDHRFGVDLADGRRFARCLRCDAWIEGPVPGDPEAERDTLAPIEQQTLPRRGKPLSTAISLKVIAILRAVHSLVFGMLALALLAVELRLPVLRHEAESLHDSLGTVANNTGPSGARSLLGSLLEKVLAVDKHTVGVLLGTATLYCVLEGVEAVGLWRERRWAEYLTAVATAGFLPLEVHELAERVTVLRVGALIVNVAVLVWLVWNKHLFGVRGGEATLAAETNWADVLAGSDVARPRA